MRTKVIHQLQNTSFDNKGENIFPPPYVCIATYKYKGRPIDLGVSGVWHEILDVLSLILITGELGAINSYIFDLTSVVTLWRPEMRKPAESLSALALSTGKRQQRYT